MSSIWLLRFTVLLLPQLHSHGYVNTHSFFFWSMQILTITSHYRIICLGVLPNSIRMWAGGHSQVQQTWAQCLMMQHNSIRTFASGLMNWKVSHQILSFAKTQFHVRRITAARCQVKHVLLILTATPIYVSAVNRGGHALGLLHIMPSQINLPSQAWLLPIVMMADWVQRMKVHMGKWSSKSILPLALLFILLSSNWILTLWYLCVAITSRIGQLNAGIHPWLPICHMHSIRKGLVIQL